MILHLYRQLQMAAISRNTAAVAQDFHNAGGGKTNKEKHFVNQNSAAKTVSKSNNCILNEATTIENNNLIDIKTSSKMCNSNSVIDYRSIMRKNVSPPAKQTNQNKENQMNLSVIWK